MTPTDLPEILRRLEPIDRERAWQSLYERRGLFGLLGRRRARGGNRLELLFMPHALAVAPIRDSASEVACLVCLMSGNVARVEPRDQSFVAASRKPANGRLMPALLDDEETRLAARDFFVRLTWVFRREKQRISASACRVLEVWQYPYWVEIFERRRGRFDLRCVDGVTAKPAGAATRRVLLEALIREHRSRSSESPSSQAVKEDIVT